MFWSIECSSPHMRGIPYKAESLRTFKDLKRPEKDHVQYVVRDFQFLGLLYSPRGDAHEIWSGWTNLQESLMLCFVWQYYLYICRRVLVRNQQQFAKDLKSVKTVNVNQTTYQISLRKQEKIRIYWYVNGILLKYDCSEAQAMII